jgi:hypothetical protein
VSIAAFRFSAVDKFNATFSVWMQFMMAKISALDKFNATFSVWMQFMMAKISAFDKFNATFSVWVQLTVPIGKRGEHPRGMALVTHLLA